MKNQYTIIDGVSKHEMNVAFMNKIEGKRLPVRFVVLGIDPGHPRVRTPLPVIVNSLKWEDGSGDKFMFQGHIMASGPGFPSRGDVQGFYDTQLRHGWLAQILPGEDSKTIVVRKLDGMEYKAVLFEDPLCWNIGSSADSAVCALIRTQSKRFGIRIEDRIPTFSKA